MEAVPSSAQTSSFGREHFLTWSRLVKKMLEPQQRCTAVHNKRANGDYHLLWLCVIWLKWKTFTGCSAVFVGLSCPVFKESTLFFFFPWPWEYVCKDRKNNLYNLIILLILALHPVPPLCSFTLLKHDRKKLYKKKLSISQVAKFSRCFVVLWSWQHSQNSFSVN